MWRCRERGKRIGTASFGADSSDKSSFFTGKPYIEDLGYAFLFRNYRADLGKWQMRDLIGYPDGWNNLAYCGNDIVNAFDLYGCASMSLRKRSVNNTFGMFSHTSMHMTVNANEYSQLTSAQKNKFISDGNGNYTSTVSGFETRNSKVPFDTYLEARYNDPSDTEGKTTHVSDVTSSTNDTLGLIKDYLNEVDKYKNNEKNTDYDWFPNDQDEANCNALQGTILDRIGANTIETDATGFNHRIGGKFFE